VIVPPRQWFQAKISEILKDEGDKTFPVKAAAFKGFLVRLIFESLRETSKPPSFWSPSLSQENFKKDWKGLVKAVTCLAFHPLTGMFWCGV